MARIRSIHPGFFTDEDLVATTMAARLLFLGLGVEADDKGVFEWKPLTIKMKVFPADNIDIDLLLSELEHAGKVRRYEIEGRSYGAIRNFRKFQRPKTPNDVHPAPIDVRTYVGLPPVVSPSFPQKGENAPQMEDGGDKMEEEREKKEEGDARARAAEPEYAFSGQVVRLNRKDYALWRKTYHAIADFDAELTSLDAWLTGQPPEKRGRWFHTVSGSLNRKHQELLAARPKGRPEEAVMPDFA